MSHPDPGPGRLRAQGRERRHGKSPSRSSGPASPAPVGWLSGKGTSPRAVLRMSRRAPSSRATSATLDLAQGGAAAAGGCASPIVVHK